MEHSSSSITDQPIAELIVQW